MCHFLHRLFQKSELSTANGFSAHIILKDYINKLIIMLGSAQDNTFCMTVELNI
jgi:hypothetical protein